MSRIRSLTHLQLQESQLTAAGLAHLAGLMRLAHLDLERAKLTDDAMAQVDKMRNLKSLSPKESKWILGGRGTRNSMIYIAMGQDPEHGEGVGHLWCIDPTKHLDGSDVSAELAVDLEGNSIPHCRMQAVDRSLGERAILNPNTAVVWHYSHYDRIRCRHCCQRLQRSKTIDIPLS